MNSCRRARFAGLFPLRRGNATLPSLKPFRVPSSSSASSSRCREVTVVASTVRSRTSSLNFLATCRSARRRESCAAPITARGSTWPIELPTREYSQCPFARTRRAPCQHRRSPREPSVLAATKIEGTLVSGGLVVSVDSVTRSHRSVPRGDRPSGWQTGWYLSGLVVPRHVLESHG